MTTKSQIVNEDFQVLAKDDLDLICLELWVAEL